MLQSSLRIRIPEYIVQGGILRSFKLEFDAGRQFGVVHFFQEAVKLFLCNDVVLGSIVPQLNTPVFRWS